MSKNTALTYLSCENNQLTSLDVSNNTALMDLICYRNSISYISIANNEYLLLAYKTGENNYRNPEPPKSAIEYVWWGVYPHEFIVDRTTRIFTESVELKHGWNQLDGTWSFLKNDSFVTGWLEDSGCWYYFDSLGIMQTGWQQINGAWFYLETSGVMVTGWKQINGSWYYLESSGAMKTGWYLSGSSWYYLDDSGEMVTGSKTIGGKTYNFNSNGVCTNP